MRAFGPWPTDLPHTDTPIGRYCTKCGDRIEEGDSGVLIPVAGPITQEEGESADDYIVRAAEAVLEQVWHIACLFQALTGRRWAGSFPRTR